MYTWVLCGGPCVGSVAVYALDCAGANTMLNFDVSLVNKASISVPGIFVCNTHISTRILCIFFVDGSVFLA